MNITIHQSIVIRTIQIRSVSNASVLQIGSTGSISGLARVANTGGFPISMAPSATPALPEDQVQEDGSGAISLVPLPSTTR